MDLESESIFVYSICILLRLYLNSLDYRVYRLTLFSLVYPSSYSSSSLFWLDTHPHKISSNSRCWNNWDLFPWEENNIEPKRRLQRWRGGSWRNWRNGYTDDKWINGSNNHSFMAIEPSFSATEAKSPFQHFISRN